MYQRQDNLRGAPRMADGLAPVAPEVRARYAIARVRQLLGDNADGTALNRQSLRVVLNVPLADPSLDAERLFALGWLGWLDGDPTSAEPPLTAAVAAFKQGSPENARSAYWLARVRVLARKPDAVAEYEKLMRTFQGSPQATCWFVDLLWRGGRAERAEQVWKSLRVNHKVMACEEAFLQEARLLLRQGDAAAAERVLREAQPSGTVNNAERLLLLAWLLAARRQSAESADFLKQADALPYPETALRMWRDLFKDKADREQRKESSDALPQRLTEFPLTVAAAAWVEAQQARGAGDSTRASSLLQTARTAPGLLPAVRYALACLGQEDFAALLNSLPGNFLAPRCRTWQAVARFCRRDIPPAELLSVLQQAAESGHGVARLAAWQQLAGDLDSLSTRPAELWPSAEETSPLAAIRRRAAVEAIVRQGPPAKALSLLASWPPLEELSRDAVLRDFLGRQLLRLALLRDENGEPSVEAIADRATALIPALPARSASEGETDPRLRFGLAVLGERSPLASLWDAARQLASGHPPDGWRATVSGLTDDPRAGALARSLAVVEAARRGDVPAVCDALEPAPCWSSLRQGPPRFVVRSLGSIRATGATAERWQQALRAWLAQWPAESLPTETRSLTLHAGLTSLDPSTAEPPSGSEPVAWFLHRASRSLESDDAPAALAWVRRALASGAEEQLTPERITLVRDSLPELERLARARLLATLARLDPAHPLPPAGLFADFSAALSESADGSELLTLATTDLHAAREKLAALARNESLPPRLAHHLALVYHRAARHFDDANRDEDADRCWRLAWCAWLAWAAGQDDPARRDALLDHLFAVQRDRIGDLLAGNEVDRARRRWELVKQLAGMTPPGKDELAAAVKQRLDHFRDELATEYLLATREVMRHGDIPEGWKADYEQGLSRLRRLLSLDRDNPRLLTALIETCGDWFADLYNTEDATRMRAEVDRFTPFALQLARIILKGGGPWELAARAALAEFFKFRGFVAADPERKKALYREALEFNPANDNVRHLLAELEAL